MRIKDPEITVKRGVVLERGGAGGGRYGIYGVQSLSVSIDLIDLKFS